MKAKILSCTCILVLSGCSLSPGAGKTTATLKLEISKPAQVALSPFNFSLLGGIAPETVSGFSCLAVNVMGVGIPSAGNNHDKRDPSLVLRDILAGTSYCSYPGVLSPPLTLSGSSTTIDLTVPVGASRVVQAIGVADPNNEVCGQPNLIQADSRTAHFFEIARSVQDINTDMAIGLSSNYNSLTAMDQAARSVDCGGPGTGTGGCINTATSDAASGHSTYDSSPTTSDFLAQSMSPAVTIQRLNSIGLWINSTASATVTVNIQTDSGAFPSGTTIFNGVSNPVLIPAGSNPLSTDFFFPGQPTLVSGTTYWIVVSYAGTYPLNVWGNSTTIYSQGFAAKHPSGGAWAAASAVLDFDFYTYQCL